jgi:hypothetical protein
MNALFVGALLSAGCPKSIPGATVKPVSTSGSKSRPATQPGNPAADQPKPTPLPTGSPEGPTPTIPLVPSAAPTAAPTVPPDLTPITKVASLLGGTVVAPAAIISNNGGAIISNNGSAIISNNGGAIISNNGGAIISNNGGAIISNNGGAYRVLDAAGPEGVLKNAFLYLTDRDERFFRDTTKNAVFTATTDTTGNYRFDITATNGFPLNKDVVVNALINGNLRMTGYMVPIDGDNQLKLNLATTLATEYLRADAYRTGKTLKSYNRDLFYTTASMTQQAINTGDISAIKTVKNHDGTNVTVGTFDLRLDHVWNLRNQYAIALSAVSKANATIKAISDNWKTLIGMRPMAVTTIAGNGGFATVNPPWNADYSAAVGGIEGDWYPATSGKAAPDTPLGFNYDVAVAKRGDIFICGYSEAAGSGFIRWIKPSGEVSSLWLPTYPVTAPVAVCVENEPTDPPANPGTVLVVDNYANRVVRIPIVDYRNDRVDPQTTFEKFSMEVVAGEGSPEFSESFDPNHPNYVDCNRDATTHAPIDVNTGSAMATYDPSGDCYNKTPKYYSVDTSTAVLPATSRWQLSDEGVRKYKDGNAADANTPYLDAQATGVIHLAGDPVPNAARYALLNKPMDVELDELGNIYIADKANHRVRMIPKVAGNYFGYRQPLDDGSNGGVAGDGVIDGYGNTVTMQPGCIYTIAGDPAWDWDKNKTTNLGGYWFGEYMRGQYDFTTPGNFHYNLGTTPTDNTATGSAQTAHLDQPYSLAFDRAKKTLYICDHDNQRIRATSRDTGAIWTAAGNTDGLTQRGTTDRDYAPADLSGTNTGGDGGAATAARLAFPKGIAVDGAGRLYIADTSSGRIRMVDTNGVITSIAGRKHDPLNPNPTDNVTDGDARLWVDLWDTEGIVLDNDGNVLLSDFRHHRVRKLWRQWD